MNDAVKKKAPLRGRLTLVALFAIFFLPILLAWVLNIRLPGWLPSGQSNHGNLIEPAMRFETSQLIGADGRSLGEDALNGKWTLLYIEPTECLDACQRAVYRMRQSRYAMGKDMERVQRLVVSPLSRVDDTEKKLRGDDPSLAVAAAAQQWIDRPWPGGNAAEIYLVDPQGYLVLWYRPDADPGGLIKDLKRLLKISKIG